MNIEDRKKVFDEFVKEPYRSMPAVWHVWKFMIWPNFFELYKRAIACIGENRKEKGWISVKDRLPEKGAEVLAIDFTCGAYCACLFDKQHINIWESMESGIDFEDGNFVVTHWMPLPPPPEKEDENRNC